MYFWILSSLSRARGFLSIFLCFTVEDRLPQEGELMENESTPDFHNRSHTIQSSKAETEHSADESDDDVRLLDLNISQ